MTACTACQREMPEAPSCDKRPGAIRYGDEPDPTGLLRPLYQDRCNDCGVKLGGFHHRYCDNEVCPVCDMQLLACQHGPLYQRQR